MSEELGAGVRILLERCKTNPQEIIEEYGQWGQLRDAVFAYKERKDRGPWLRGLTEQEIDALYEMFNSLYRGVFDAWVMKTVLGGDEEKPELDMYGLSQGKRRLQGTIPPGTWQNVATQISNTSVISQQSLVARLKQELGIK
jgi:hypothetical protein